MLVEKLYWENSFDTNTKINSAGGQITDTKEVAHVVYNFLNRQLKT
jgi:hypothetical protein